MAYCHICWYIERLVQKGNSPGTISNVISHLRTFYKLAGLRDSPLHHYRVRLALRAVAINIRHVSRAKLDAPPVALKKAIQLNAGRQEEEATNLGFIIMYVGLLRQSSLAPATTAKFDNTRHPTIGDARLEQGALKLKLKWTKTLQKALDAKTIVLPATNDPQVCPVKAYKRYLSVRPNIDPAAPLLTYQDGNPITVRFLAKRWSELVKDMGLSPTELSLHSLRKGGAAYAYNKGGTRLNDVMTQGTWRSLAVRNYIRPREGQITSLHEAMAKL